MPFKNISQETAIITDLPMEITDADTELEADVIGFNRTYQWYSNDVADNISGTAIDGATSKYFTPSDYPLADYYYCVVTSTDGDYEPVTIRTGVAKNNAKRYEVCALGGSIRVNDGGMRFGFIYDESQGKVDEYGFIYANGCVDDFDINTKGVRKTVANNRITDKNGITTFNLVFINLPKSAYDSVISARAYVKAGDEYYYSDVLQRSFNQIAQAVLDESEIDEITKRAIINLIEKEG